MDVVGDALNAIKMGFRRKNRYADVRGNALILAILKVLKWYGFIDGYIVKDHKGQSMYRVFIKYTDAVGDYPGDRRAFFSGLKRVSKLGRRVYATSSQLGGFNRGKGFAIVSTSKGVVSSIYAMKLGVGGEVVCMVW